MPASTSTTLHATPPPTARVRARRLRFHARTRSSTDTLYLLPLSAVTRPRLLGIRWMGGIGCGSRAWGEAIGASLSGYTNLISRQ